LKSGYNVGIDADRIKKIELLEKKIKRIEKPQIIGIEQSSKDVVAILGCGGTIASKIEYKTGAVYPAISSEELVTSFPELSKKRIKTKTLFSIFSEDMTPAHWQEIAEETAKEIKAGAKGVVLLHGTDTMHYTSAALSFMLKTPVPVVLVGAQRSSDRGSSDNLMNLMSAAALAESDIAEIGICMHGSSNDDFCYLINGTRARKLHTSERDAFKFTSGGDIAKIWWEENKIQTLRSYKQRGRQKLEVDTKINPNVALIQVHPGIKPEFIEKISGIYDGVVIAGTGLGHVPTNTFNDPRGLSILSAIKSLIERNIPVVMSPQTIFGRIDMNVYSNGRALLEAGVIGNYCDWLPETALVKLMFALGHTNDMKKINEMMLTNYAGEISERSEIV
jgi:glutamyl-tRNA(Gln) amidotransferase subunit D